MKKNWKIKNQTQIDNSKIENMQKKHNITKLVAKMLLSKNITTDEQVQEYLNPTRHSFHDPFTMPDMPKAIDRIIKAIENNEKILVYGDYDVDGITSVTIIKRFMHDRGIEVGAYIPNRINEGYGLNINALQKISEEKYNLIITVDCGITSIQEVEEAKKLGIDVIITDHHEPGEEIPKAIAVIDCKRKDNKYQFRELAGCGVAFKLIQALAQKMQVDENEYLKYLDIACLGTISDIVPLVDENRVIAKLGLLLIQQTRNIGLKELLRTSGYKTINSTAVSYGLSPRINACGRMGHQEDALNLFLTNDPIEARSLSSKLEGYNHRRQQIEKQIEEEAMQQIDLNDPNKAIVIGKENWHHGVIGIVSSKITDKFYKPSILLCFEGEDSKGSGRSIEGFDLHKALEKNNQYLTSYGGHSMAIGLGLKTENFEKFKKQFLEYANKTITEEMSESELPINDELTASDLTIDEIESLSLLEPFGEANENPIFVIKNAKINAIRSLTEGKHLKLTLQIENITIEAIGFNLGNLASNYQIGDKIDIAGNVEINEFNNKQTIQIITKDIRKSIV